MTQVTKMELKDLEELRARTRSFSVTRTPSAGWKVAVCNSPFRREYTAEFQDKGSCLQHLMHMCWQWGGDPHIPRLALNTIGGEADDEWFVSILVDAAKYDAFMAEHGVDLPF